MCENSSPYFEDITSKMEERRCDLVGRHKYLREKITTMERSIPALLAYNMWMARQKCVDAPYCKIREIMKNLAPYPDQTEKLLQSLKKTVTALNGETAELHEKIIDVDVKLEETGMELESVELVNKEMNDTLNNLEKEVQSYTTPSLHSIHSEDVLCLSKIRQLAKEELNLKNCIKELEMKETLFKGHMDRLLSTCRRQKISCVPNVECSVKGISCAPKKCLWQKPAGHREKKKLEQEDNNVIQTDAIVSTSEHGISTKDQEVQPEVSQEKVEKSSSWIPNWWKSNNKMEQTPPRAKDKEKSASSKTEHNDTTKSNATILISKESVSPQKEKKQQKMNNNKSPISRKPEVSTTNSKFCGHLECPLPPSTKWRTTARKPCAGKYVPSCNIPCKKIVRSSRKPPLCVLPRCITKDHGIKQSCKPLMMSPCNFESPCEMCPWIPCKEHLSLRTTGNCKCNCKGKCAGELSNAECNCSDDPFDHSEGYRPTASKFPKNYVEESNSEDEFCECCSCGCEDSDECLSCQCN